MQDVDKTWLNLKTHFHIAARHELNLLQDPTSAVPTTYPGSANSVIMPPPTQVELLLTTTVNKLVKVMSKATPGGAAANTAGTTTTTTPHPHTPQASNPAGGREPTAAEAATMSYCWSHGYCPHREGTWKHTPGRHAHVIASDMKQLEQDGRRNTHLQQLESPAAGIGWRDGHQTRRE